MTGSADYNSERGATLASLCRLERDHAPSSLRSAYFGMISALRFEQMPEAIHTEQEFQEEGGPQHG